MVDCHETHFVPFPSDAVLVQSAYTVACDLHFVSQNVARSEHALALLPDDEELLLVAPELELLLDDPEDDDDEPLLQASPLCAALPWLHW